MYLHMTSTYLSDRNAKHPANSSTNSSTSPVHNHPELHAHQSALLFFIVLLILLQDVSSWTVAFSHVQKRTLQNQDLPAMILLDSYFY